MPKGVSRGSARGVFGALVLLTTSVVLSVGLVAVYRAFELAADLDGIADAFDASWDPIVIEGGVLRVEGPRRFTSSDGSVRVDPDDAMNLDIPPLDTAQPDRMLVLRSREVIQVSPFQQRSFKYGSLMEAMDLTTLRIDSVHLRAFNRGWGLVLCATLVGVLVAFVGGIQFFSCVVLAGGAAVPVAAIERGRGVPGGRVFAVALALSAAIPPLWGAGSLFGISTSCCVDLCVFPPLIALATFGISRLRGS